MTHAWQWCSIPANGIHCLSPLDWHHSIHSKVHYNIGANKGGSIQFSPTRFPIFSGPMNSIFFFVCSLGLNWSTPFFHTKVSLNINFKLRQYEMCAWWLLDYCNGQGSHCWSYDTRICIAEFALEGVLSCVCVQLSSLNIDSSIGSSIQQPQCWVHFHSTQQHQHVSNSIPPRPVDGGWSTGCAMIFIFVPVQEFEILRPHSVCMNKFVLWNKIELSGQLLKTGSALASACGCARNN